jgi:hypothetical protein
VTCFFLYNLFHNLISWPAKQQQGVINVMTIQLFVAILLLHLLNREEEEEEGFKWKNIINHEINVSGLHKASGLEVAVEGKSLQHQPQVYINNECVGNHILHLGIYRNCMLCSLPQK